MDYTDYSVLYVDDEIGNLIVFKKNFEMHFDIITCESPLEAIKILKEKNIAVLLADHKMPGMTGVELLAHVKQHHPDVIRMIITAYSDLDIAMNAINIGHVHRYILKPWKAEEIMMIILSNIELYQKNMLLRNLQSELIDASRMAALGTMTVGVTHQLGGHLTFLRNCSTRFRALYMKYTALLKDGQTGNDNNGNKTSELSDYGYYSARQEKIVRNLEDMVRSFTDAYRSKDRGLKKVILCDLLDTLANLLSPEVRMRGSLIIECRRDIIVEIETAKIAQILLNIMLNAFQSLDVQNIDSNRIIVRACVKDGALLFSVTDNGAGIPEEDLKRIYDPFFSTGKKGGTGLGLAITRELLSLLKGSIDITSQPGVGTNCRLRIPLSPS